MDIEYKKISDERHKVMCNGKTIGWVSKWWKKDWWNGSKVLYFAAKPIGTSQCIRWDCPTFDSALAYIKGYHEDVIGEK